MFVDVFDDPRNSHQVYQQIKKKLHSFFDEVRQTGSSYLPSIIIITK